MTNDKEIIKNFLNSNGIYDLDKSQQLIAVVKLVAKNPFGEGRTIEETLVTKKVGTCEGKHLVLQACLDELGIIYRPVVCTFRWTDQSINYPDNLRAILAEGEWEHGHNFVQIKTDDGNFTDTDITFNPELKPYGFRSFPENWDGKTPFIAFENIIRRWENVDVIKMKRELINSLKLELRERRKRFLKELLKWVSPINR